MHFVGKIDLQIYRCISERITTDEVIVTDERIQHIEARHPNDFEQYKKYLEAAICDPDFILEANKPNTAFILKRIEEHGIHLQLVIRVKVFGEPNGYKNSIITFLKINDKNWRKYLRNKKVLYKKE